MNDIFYPFKKNILEKFSKSNENFGKKYLQDKKLFVSKIGSNDINQAQLKKLNEIIIKIKQKIDEIPN